MRLIQDISRYSFYRVSSLQDYLLFYLMLDIYRKLDRFSVNEKEKEKERKGKNEIHQWTQIALR